jgi:serine/threonine-protein kinase
VIPAAQAGDVLDQRYHIVKMIGRGAMADVFEAKDSQTGDEVAIKLMRSNIAKDLKAAQRFEQEARLQERVSHRNVARVYGHGLFMGKPFLALELLRGRSLLDVLRKNGRVAPVQAASYGWQALDGLAATHAAGVLHRDLKPANLMLEPSQGPIERVVLIDFGFASLGAKTGLTAVGHVVGSISYLAPERLQGIEPDERADLYGIGVILYELLVGRPPFTGGDVQVVQHHIRTAPQPPSAVLPEADLPMALEDLVMRALSKSPDDRPPSARAMAEELDRAINAG